MTFDPSLVSVLDGLGSAVECTLYQTQESDFGHKLESFVNEMSRLAPGKVKIIRGTDNSGLPVLPCFSIGRSERANIFYAALPIGHQLPPFLRALESIVSHEKPVLNAKSVSLSQPAEIQVIISENCPHCPKTVDAAIPLASRNPLLSLCIIDAAQYTDVVQKYNVQSAPSIIVDRRLVLVGSTTADRLMELIRSRGTPEFEIEVILSLIEARKIAEAAECLVHDAGRQVILSLVQDTDFSKRLSALVVIEKALEKNPDTVRAMAPSFVGLLSHRDARIRGDIADLLGKIGDANMIACLEPLTSDPDPDVAEIAVEAIAELRKLPG